jgi:glutathione S-transferase
VDNTFSIADLSVFDVIDAASELVPGCLVAYPNLAQFHKRVASRERIAEYLSSPRRNKAASSL